MIFLFEITYFCFTWKFFDYTELLCQPFRRETHKMVKHTQIIVWVCLTILWGWCLNGYIWIMLMDIFES